MPDCPIRFRRLDFRKHRKRFAPKLAAWARNGWLNMVGGCCGTTPDHIARLRIASRDCQPRVQLHSGRSRGSRGEAAELRGILRPRKRSAQDDRIQPLQFPGSSRSTSRPSLDSLSIGERTNITGSPKFSKLILAGDFEGAVAVARQQVANGANILDVNIDEGMIDSEATMTRFLNLDWQRTGNRARPDHDRQLEMERDRSGIEMCPGQKRGQFDLA